MENQTTNKKRYQKPIISVMGSVEDVTGWCSTGAGEPFGGVSDLVSGLNKRGSRGKGPADMGS